MTLVGRVAVVDVAVIENTAGYPLTIGDFIGRTVSDSSLRTPQDDDASLQSAPSTREHPFTIEVLNPGEKDRNPIAHASRASTRRIRSASHRAATGAGARRGCKTNADIAGYVRLRG